MHPSYRLCPHAAYSLIGLFLLLDFEILNIEGLALTRIYTFSDQPSTINVKQVKDFFNPRLPPFLIQGQNVGPPRNPGHCPVTETFIPSFLSQAALISSSLLHRLTAEPVTCSFSGLSAPPPTLGAAEPKAQELETQTPLYPECPQQAFASESITNSCPLSVKEFETTPPKKRTKDVINKSIPLIGNTLS